MNSAPHWLQGNLDLVSFIYGAAFVLLGTVILSQPSRAGDFKLRNILWLLAGFGLTNGLTEWVVTWGMVKGDGTHQASIRVMSLVVSYLFLFEFGRRLLLIGLEQDERSSEPGHVLGLWLYLPIIVPILLSAIYSEVPLVAIEIWTRYTAGFAGSVFTAAGFWLYRSKSGEGLEDIGVRNYFAMASVAILAFGFVAGLVGPKVSSFPANWLNEESFLAVTGVPAAAVRALMAVLLAFAVGAIIFRANQAAGLVLQEKLIEANRRNRLILQAAGEGILELDDKNIITFINPAGRNMLGYPEDEVLGQPIKKLLQAPGEQSVAIRSEILLACETQRPARGSQESFWKYDGTSFPADFTCTPVRKKGTLLCTVVTFNDISEHERLMRLLRDTQALAKVGGWDFHVGSQRLSWTEEVYHIHEIPLGTSMNFEEAVRFYEPESRAKFREAVRSTLEQGVSFDLELELTTQTGRSLWVRTLGKPHKKNGKTVRISGTMQDITDRRITEIALRDTKEFYELILDSVPMRIGYIQTDERFAYVNNRYEDWFDASRDELNGSSVRELVGSDDYRSIKPRIREVLKGERVSFEVSMTRNDEAHQLQVEYLPHLSRSNEVLGFFSVVQDITNRKVLEAQLLQAQKMEAVGQLTGGIAHDFNNLLGVILGNLQLLERPLKNEERLHKKIKTATRAAIRGADLTRRLLSFSRRQLLEPKVLDLNSLVASLDDLLRRTLGEGIAIETVFEENLWATTVDRGQMENALLNLAINARDAMPDGGSLIIETRNVVLDQDLHAEAAAGEYVMVSVSDTGCGMSEEVRQQVFEPFFTTKGVGQGSGLGLSMVYGFVEQSGGQVVVQSEEGFGTSLDLYFPRTKTAALAKVEETAVAQFVPGGDETILVVEDEEDVRFTVVALLHDFGYETLEAENGPKALDILKSRDDIDLLFTDIMMPGGMRGPVLAHQAREIRPDLKVLFTSGYAESAILHRGALVSESAFISKPYRNEELALKLRTVLDQQEEEDAAQPQSSVNY